MLVNNDWLICSCLTFQTKLLLPRWKSIPSTAWCLVDHWYHHQMHWPKNLTCDNEMVYEFLFLSSVVLKWEKGNEQQEELLWSVTEQNTSTLHQKPIRKIKAKKAVELSVNTEKGLQEMCLYKWSWNYLLLLKAN